MYETMKPTPSRIISFFYLVPLDWYFLLDSWRRLTPYTKLFVISVEALSYMTKGRIAIVHLLLYQFPHTVAYLKIAREN